MADSDDTRHKPRDVTESLGPASGDSPTVKRRNRWIAGLSLVAASAVFIIAGIVLAPYLAAESDSPPSQAAGTTSPTAAAPKAQPGDCRPFEQVVDVGGVEQTLTGRACMQPDGSWRIVEQN